MTRKDKFAFVTDYFTTHRPDAATELLYTNPYELLVSVILSAQCTDKRVNMVTPALFKDFRSAEELAESNSDVIFQYIKSISYPNNKAKHLVGMAKMLVKDFNNIILHMNWILSY